MIEYKSTEISELFSALSKAQAEMPIIGETASNSFFKSKYAKFADIIKATRPCLTKNGLAIIQRIYTNQDVNILVTMLVHNSGQYIESSIKIQPDKNDIQSLGKTISYLKRYQLLSIIAAVTSDDPDDDDGEEDRKSSNDYINEQQLATLNKIMQGNIKAQELPKRFNVTDRRKILKKDFNDILKFLQTP